MITRNVDYFRSSTGQLIVSRFINKEGEVEIGQAHVSFGEINDSFYDKIHETGSIKKERGASKGDDSFLGEEYFKNKVPFSFKEGKCLVLTYLVSFETYSDESLKPIREQEGISDCFFQEKSFKEIKNLDIDLSRYSSELQPPVVEPPTSEEDAKNECKRLEYELDIPIFGVKGSQDIQFINGPISLGPLNFQIEPEEGGCGEEEEEESAFVPQIQDRYLRFQTYENKKIIIKEIKVEGNRALSSNEIGSFAQFRGLLPLLLLLEEEEEEEEEERGRCDPPEDYEPPKDKFYGHFPIKFS